MNVHLFAAQTETLAWFLGNTFALAAWWIISGFLSGVLLSMFGGTISFMLTGRTETQVQVQRALGSCGGALIGMSGGITVGAIGKFSGLIGMVYLWGFVGMILAAFQSAAQGNLHFSRFDQDWDNVDLDHDETRGSFIGQIVSACSQLGAGPRSGEEIVGAVAGGVVGALYGTLTGLIVPLSATAGPNEDIGNTVAGAAAVWAVLGGFGGWVVGNRCGVYGGMIVLVLGLLFGSAFGGVIAMVGELFGDVITDGESGAVLVGAVNGAIGGAFFGSIAAHEVIHKRFP